LLSPAPSACVCGSVSLSDLSTQLTSKTDLSSLRGSRDIIDRFLGIHNINIVTGLVVNKKEEKLTQLLLLEWRTSQTSKEHAC